MMGNVQNISHKDSYSGLYQKDNVMCLKFDTIFLFRVFKFFYYALFSGQPSINIQCEHQETGFFIFFAESG